MEDKEKVETHIENIAGGDPEKDKPSPQVKQVTSNSDQQHADLSDMINYSLSTGGNPVTHKQGRAMFNQARVLYGDKTAHDLLDQLIIFNQRDDQKKKGAEDKIKSFYEIMHGSPELEKLKQRVSVIGYGPVAQYINSQDLDVNQTEGVDRLAKK